MDDNITDFDIEEIILDDTDYSSITGFTLEQPS